MFCTQCGQRNTEEAKFCMKCGALLQTQPEPKAASRSSPAQEPMVDSSPDAETSRTYVHPRDSGAVTALSVIGFVFGLIGMFASFVPFFGSLAFFIGIPALLVSLLSLFIAAAQNAKKSFAITAVTICGIGIAVSYWQYSSIISLGNKAAQKTQEMLRRNPSTTSQNYQLPVSQSKKPATYAKNLIKITNFEIIKVQTTGGNSGQFTLIAKEWDGWATYSVKSKKDLDKADVYFSKLGLDKSAVIYLSDGVVVGVTSAKFGNFGTPPRLNAGRIE